MRSVTMLEFRRDAESVIRQVQAGEPMLLTYRGKPAVRLEPVEEKLDTSKNTLLTLCELGERLVPPGPITTLTNEEIDRLVYGL